MEPSHGACLSIRALYELRSHMSIDQCITDYVVQYIRAPWLTPVMEAVSDIATAPVLIAMLLILAAFVPGKGVGRFCTLNLLGVTLLNQAMKFAIQRPRPDEALRLVDVGGFSFPSGHSMAAMAFFGLIIWLVWRYVDDRRRCIWLTTAFAAIIVLIGFSRIYLGVHYFSDVICGFAISCVWLAGYTRYCAPHLLGIEVRQNPRR